VADTIQHYSSSTPACLPVSFGVDAFTSSVIPSRPPLFPHSIGMALPGDPASATVGGSATAAHRGDRWRWDFAPASTSNRDNRVSGLRYLAEQPVLSAALAAAS